MRREKGVFLIVLTWLEKVSTSYHVHFNAPSSLNVKTRAHFDCTRSVNALLISNF